MVWCIGLAAGICWVVAAAPPSPAPGTLAPPAAKPPSATGESSSTGKQVRISDLPPHQRLGARSAVVGQRIPVIPTVVVVPDAASYTAAIGEWSLAGRYPVLLDDGSWASREGIARFVRAFEPTHVVRWTAPPSPPTAPGQEAKPAVWPEDNPAQRALIESAAARAWRETSAAQTPDDLNKRWRELQYVPPGVVVASVRDGAWTAALALAAGRGQPIAWADSADAGWPENQPDGWMLADQADAITDRIFKACEDAGWKSRELGDDIDAVTICLNCPAKVFLGLSDQRNMLALTDVIGRPKGAAAQGAAGEAVARWAWCGQIIGTEASAAYDAMCALFLTPKRAWLFDGYDDSKPWNDYDATAAAVVLEKLGVKTLVDDQGGSGSGRWRWRVAGQIDASGLAKRPDDSPAAGEPALPLRGIDAGIICVNTSGNADFFDLKPGQCKPADVPMLLRPSLAYVVHSWSATAPASRATVGGRWRERGAFAYVGSVNEPYLQGFVPTPIVTTRLGAGLPLGAAVRVDDGPPWKITVLGDPLYTFGRQGPRSGGALPLGGAVDIGSQLGEQLKSRDFAGAVGSLRALAREQDAARLLVALIAEQPEALTPELALAGVGAAFFAGDRETFLRVYSAALPLIEKRSELVGVRDLIWHVFGPLPVNLSAAQVDLLTRSLRPDNLVRDAADLAPIAKRTGGQRATLEIVVQARALTSDEAVLREVERVTK